MKEYGIRRLGSGLVLPPNRLGDLGAKGFRLEGV